jgi:hypothetical protein
MFLITFHLQQAVILRMLSITSPLTLPPRTSDSQLHPDPAMHQLANISCSALWNCPCRPLRAWETYWTIFVPNAHVCDPQTCIFQSSTTLQGVGAHCKCKRGAVGKSETSGPKNERKYTVESVRQRKVT